MAATDGNLLNIIRGTLSNPVNLVFVAEGYQASEKSKFFADAAAVTNYFFSKEKSLLNDPFYTYKNYFQVDALFVASNQSGLDQPNKNIYVDTYFNASQHGADGRLVYGDESKVLNYVSQYVPSGKSEMVVVLVNSSLYGGAGGNPPWTTAGNPNSYEIALHEIGHSYAKLQDEYVDPSLVASFPLSGLQGVNVTSSLSNIPWRAWMGYQDFLGVVGTYEGGYFRSTDVWRATNTSKMLNLNTPFNAPQKEAFALNFYRDIGDYLTVGTDIPGIYYASARAPSVLSYSWTSNNSQYTNTSVLDTYKSKIGAGVSINLSTIDNTGLIRNNLVSTKQTENFVTSAYVTKNIASQNYTLSENSTLLKFTDVNNKIYSSLSSYSNYIDASGGLDTLIVQGALSSAYQIESSNTTWLIGSNDKPLHALSNVERVQFTDATIALDIGKDQIAGSGYMLYKAAFNRTPDASGLGYWINKMDGGMSYNAVAQSFINSAEFSAAYYSSNPSVHTLISRMYVNVLNRLPDDNGLAFWQEKRTTGGWTTADVLGYFSTSAENVTNVTPLIANGIQYQQFVG
jgi:hypothetical protein